MLVNSQSLRHKVCCFWGTCEYSKSTKTSTGICSHFKTVVAFGGEGRRREGNGIGVGFSSIC